MLSLILRQSCCQALVTKPVSRCNSTYAVRTSPSLFLKQQTSHRRRNGLSCLCSADPVSGSKTAEDINQELLKGCKTVVRELAGLDFGQAQVRLYFQNSVRLPKKWQDVDIARVRAAAVALTAAPGAGAPGGSPDVGQLDGTALRVVQDMLSEIWRWRRRGGGSGDEETSQPYVYALQELQSLDPSQAAANIDNVTSSLLDNLDLSESEKRQMGKAVESVALAGIGSFTWGTIAFAALLLVLVNFLFLSSGGG